MCEQLLKSNEPIFLKKKVREPFFLSISMSESEGGMEEEMRAGVTKVMQLGGSACFESIDCGVVR